MFSTNLESQSSSLSFLTFESSDSHFFDIHLSIINMPQPTLPTELLRSIFSNLSSSPSDLVQLLYSSKAFSTLIKPLLYKSIKITKKYQRASLALKREEDSNLVQSVSIVGSDLVWNNSAGEFGDHFKEDGESVCELGAGCIKDVFDEKYFKLDCESLLAIHSVNEHWIVESGNTALRSLYVKDIHEDPKIELEKIVFSPKLAQYLSNLSILTHRGSSLLWKSILSKKNLPSLRQLTIYDVTIYEPENSPPRRVDHVGTTMLSFDESYGGQPHPMGKPKGAQEYVETEAILRSTDLINQLEILVAPSYPFLRRYPSLNYLEIVAEDSRIDKQTKYAVVHIGNNTFSEACDNVFMNLSQLICYHDGPINLEYFGVGDWADGMCEMYDEALDGAKEKGVKVYFDSDEGEGLIPKTFVEYLATKGKGEKEKKEKKGGTKK